MLHDQFLQFFLKNDESVLNLIFEGFPQISFPPFFSALVGNIKFLGFKRTVQTPKYIFQSHSENMKLSIETLILEMQLVILQKKFRYNGAS